MTDSKMFFRLPNEIKTKIFEFDGTERENFNETVHQIRFGPSLYQIKVGRGKESFWWKSVLYSVRYRIQMGSSTLMFGKDFMQELYWLRYRESVFKKKN